MAADDLRPYSPPVNTHVSAVLLSLAVTLWSATTHAQQASHVRVVWHESPATTAFVSWSTAGPAETHLVWDHAAGASASAYANELKPALSGHYDEDEDELFHHARLTGLSPSTPIHFRVVAGEDASRDYYFVTAPDDARPFVLLYGGDSRSDFKSRRSMNERIRDLVQADPSVIALIHGGDYVERGSSWSQWDQWLRDWQTTVGNDGRVLPILPARGNHESNGVLYNRVFAFPGDARRGRVRGALAGDDGAAVAGLACAFAYVLLAGAEIPAPPVHIELAPAFVAIAQLADDAGELEAMQILMPDGSVLPDVAYLTSTAAQEKLAAREVGIGFVVPRRRWRKLSTSRFAARRWARHSQQPVAPGRTASQRGHQARISYPPGG